MLPQPDKLLRELRTYVHKLDADLYCKCESHEQNDKALFFKPTCCTLSLSIMLANQSTLFTTSMTPWRTRLSVESALYVLQLVTLMLQEHFTYTNTAKKLSPVKILTWRVSALHTSVQVIVNCSLCMVVPRVWFQHLLHSQSTKQFKSERHLTSYTTHLWWSDDDQSPTSQIK